MFTKNGIMLFAVTVLPAIFPFMIFSGILIRCGIVNDIARWLNPVTRVLFGTSGYGGYCFGISILSGYPMGAYSISELYNGGQITSDEAQRMTAFCSSGSPVFIIAGVGLGMLGSSDTGYALLAINLISAILTGIFFRKPLSQNSVTDITIPKNEEYLGASIKKAIGSILLVGGYITVFAVAVSFIQLGLYNISDSNAMRILSAAVTAIIEMTSGCAALSHFSYFIALPVISAGLAWGGFSVILQQLSFLRSTKINVKRFFFTRLIQAAIAFLVCDIYHLYLANNYIYASILFAIQMFIVLIPKRSKDQPNTFSRSSAHTRPD